jgi:hypothetical protein
VATRRVKELTNIEIDEISLVDVPANQHARVAIAKRAIKEDNVPEIYNENGELLDADLLEPGDTVFDSEGNAFEVVLEEANEQHTEYDREQELEPVGKSFADEVRSELSKAFTDIERDEVISKALGQVDVLSKRLEQAELIAKSERDLRLLGEYVEVAKAYNIPVEPTTLGPVLQRMAESMSYEDCSVIHKALTSAGSMIFEEVGVLGTGDNNDVMSQIDAFLEQNVSKSESISKAGQVEQFFAQNPDAYDQYRADQINR